MTETRRKSSTRPRLSELAAGGISLVAVVEAWVALAAPSHAPTDEDWRSSAVEVRAGWRSGDLIVAAPTWADPLMRLYLGDLVPPRTAGRMDAARFARVWEIGQRGAHATETEGATLVSSYRHGALTVRLVEKRAAAMTYDFLDHLSEARVFRGSGERGTCPFDGDSFQCPVTGHVHRQTVEVDGRLRQALLAPPIGEEPLVVEYPAARLGRELAVGTGLHNVWSRKGGDGSVTLRVLIDGRLVLTTQADNDSGWRVERVDTSAKTGLTALVRFEVTSSRPKSRDFSFAAEARD